MIAFLLVDNIVLQVYRKWLEEIGRVDLFDIPIIIIKKKLRVCERHFTRDDYRTYKPGKKRELKFNSVPHAGM